MNPRYYSQRRLRRLGTQRIPGWPRAAMHDPFGNRKALPSTLTVLKAADHSRNQEIHEALKHGARKATARIEHEVNNCLSGITGPYQLAAIQIGQERQEEIIGTMLGKAYQTAFGVSEFITKLSEARFAVVALRDNDPVLRLEGDGLLFSSIPLPDSSTFNGSDWKNQAMAYARDAVIRRLFHNVSGTVSALMHENVRLQAMDGLTEEQARLMRVAGSEINRMANILARFMEAIGTPYGELCAKEIPNEPFARLPGDTDVVVKTGDELLRAVEEYRYRLGHAAGFEEGMKEGAGLTAARAAHETNNALTPIIGCSDLIQMESGYQELPEQMRRWLGIIFENATRIRNVIERIKVGARNPERTDLNGCPVLAIPPESGVEKPQ